jgi:dynamin 1-like protein
MNRSSSESDKKKAEKSIEDQLEIEKEFLKNNFPGIANRNGIPYLEKSLSNLLMRHIQKCLPNLRERVSRNLDKYEKIMENCGDEVVDKNRALSKIITNFIKDFESIIDGTSVDLDAESEALIGGPAIRKVFDEKFSKEMAKIEPLISKENIISYVKKIGGPRPSVFAPEILFQSIVKKQIERLRNPSLKCAENVQKEMEKVIKQRVQAQADLKRFPELMRKINEVMMKLLNERFPKTRKYIEVIIKTELSSINTNHPDFSIQAVLEEYEKKEVSDV